MIVPPGLHLRPIVFFLIFYLLLWLLLLRLLLLLLLLLPPTLHLPLPFLHSLPHPLIVLVLLFSSFVVVFFIIFILFSVYTFVSEAISCIPLFYYCRVYLFDIYVVADIGLILYLRLEFLFFVWCLYSLSVFISSFSLIPYRVRVLCLLFSVCFCGYCLFCVFSLSGLEVYLESSVVFFGYNLGRMRKGRREKEKVK